MAMSDEKQEKMVLCGATSYDMKYYFNEKFNGIFRKTQKIENILESIQKTREAVFQIDDHKIVIKKP